MLKIRAFILSACAVACIAASLAAQEIKFAPLGDFKLEDGETIRDLRLGYRTVGTLNAGRSNAILWPSWFSGTSAQLLQYAGPGKLLDTSKYFVIFVDALGDGVTTSPSNSATQPRMDFPKFTIRDMVNAEYKLATERLGLKHLLAVMGVSMGGFQTFEWMVAFPDFMDKAVSIVGTPRKSASDLLLSTTEEHAIELDPAWNNGNYSSPPEAGMRLVADIHTMNLRTSEYLSTHVPPDQFQGFLARAEQETIHGFDANDWVRQLQASKGQDISRHFGGSMEKAAAAVRAQVLIIVATQDHMVNPARPLAFAKLIHAQTLELSSDCGHLSNGCEAAKMNPIVQQFLEK
ncbi:MAG TPA: alpha/beta fold hydrolase [Terriglobia bacterium]|nr:alpha/beta fold hydrolase [Terriglobia bacterium]